MLLIVRYDCYVSGKLTGGVDYQVRHYDVPAGADMLALVREEPVVSYLNGEGESVEWKFCEIVAEEAEPDFSHGNEVIGFITGLPESASDM